MADTLVENRVCEACGVDVRSGSLFCYNCGESVEPKSEVVVNEDNEIASQIWFRENIGNNGDESGESKSEEIKIESDSEIAKTEEVVENPIDKTAQAPVEKTSIHEQAKLKSAASLRRKSKIIQRKKVEVVWEEHENAPNGWFIIVALVLAGLAAGIIYLAIHLR